MRKYIIALVAVTLLLGACATTPEARQRKREQQMRVAQTVRQQINDMRFRINVNTMHPLGYPARMLTSNYYLELKGDTVVSYLPYMGRAYNVPYGGGKALNFEGKLIGCEVIQEKSNLYRMVLDIDNEEALYRYVIVTYDNGSSTIDVYTRERQSISFNGMMEVE